MIKIDFHHHFIKQFDKLDPDTQIQVEERLELFRHDQHDRMLNNHALKGEYAGFRSINISGDFRAIYFQQEEDKIVFKFIGTHSQLYG